MLPRSSLSASVSPYQSVRAKRPSHFQQILTIWHSLRSPWTVAEYLTFHSWKKPHLNFGMMLLAW